MSAMWASPDAYSLDFKRIFAKTEHAELRSWYWTTLNCKLRLRKSSKNAVLKFEYSSRWICSVTARIRHDYGHTHKRNGLNF